MKCSKCGKPTGEWKTVWFTDIGGKMQEWVPHICVPKETVATSEEA